MGLTVILNVGDLLATIVYIDGGFAEEANPIMAAALRLGYAPFAVLKISLVSAGVLVLSRHRRHLLARMGTVAVTTAYGLVMLYHTSWSAVLLVD